MKQICLVFQALTVFDGIELKTSNHKALSLKTRYIPGKLECFAECHLCSGEGENNV